MFSTNVFAQEWGNWIRVGLTFGLAVGSLFLVVKLLVRLKVKKGWVAGLAAFLGIGAGIAVGVLFPWPRNVGRYQALYSVRGPWGERLAVLSRDVAGKVSTEYFHLLTFDLRTGDEIGRAALATRSHSGPHVSVRGWRGRQAWISSPEGWLVADLSTATVIGRERDLARGLGPYRSQSFDPETFEVSVLLQDGRTRRLPIASRPAPESSVSVEALDPGTTCASATSADGPAPARGSAAGLLRPRTVSRGREPCAFGAGLEQFRLVLHRRTAFGTGAVLASAVAADGSVRWTLDLSERCGGAEEELQIVHARWAGERLHLLLGRSKLTLYAVQIDPQRGQVLAERALY